MNRLLRQKLEKLRADHEAVTGRPFSRFHCPILFRDEDVALCQGHVINRAFPRSSRIWTVQRKDVDHFYGAHFESDFVDIQYYGNTSPAEVLADRKLRKKFKPTILLNSRPVEHYVPKDKTNVPDKFTGGDLEHENRSVKFVLKIEPDEMMRAADQNWEITISKDIRLPALVSLIKSAHLTLFELLGYRYALSAAGHFVGNDILGQFFCQNMGKPKQQVLKAATDFFDEFVHMVRPVLSHPSSPPGSIPHPGTLADRTLMVCGPEAGPLWSFIVFVRTADVVNAVMIPVFEHPDAPARFLGFLKNDNEYIEARHCRVEADCWRTDKKFRDITWPKTNATLHEHV